MQNVSAKPPPLIAPMPEIIGNAESASNKIEPEQEAVIIENE